MHAIAIAIAITLIFLQSCSASHQTPITLSSSSSSAFFSFSFRLLHQHLQVLFLLSLKFLLSCYFRYVNSRFLLFSDGVEDVHQERYEEVVVVPPWTARRSMAEGASFRNVTLVLAKERTRRQDWFNGFNLYNGGWNISNAHYLTVTLFFFALQLLHSSIDYSN